MSDGRNYEVSEEIPAEAAAAEEQPPSRRFPTPPILSSFIDAGLECADRRAQGLDKTVPLPWPSLAHQFGGGLWPGLHILVAGTGFGKSAWALQIALHAAKLGVPVAYVGLELDDKQVALRLIAEEGRMGWSKLYLGHSTAEERAKARAVAERLRELPIHLELGPPQGWQASSLETVAYSMRKRYPETEGAGSRPLLLVLDFLQIVGEEAGQRTDMRERIAQAAYRARHVARTANVTVLVISSAARDKYGVLTGDFLDAGLRARIEKRSDGTPELVERRVMQPDLLVGLGKESGEIEYSADSVTVAARFPHDFINTGDGTTSVIFVTAKGRATGAAWTELRFNGHRFAETRSASILTFLEEHAQRRAKRKGKSPPKLEEPKASDAPTNGGPSSVPRRRSVAMEGL